LDGVFDMLLTSLFYEGLNNFLLKCNIFFFTMQISDLFSLLQEACL